MYLQCRNFLRLQEKCSNHLRSRCFHSIEKYSAERPMLSTQFSWSFNAPSSVIPCMCMSKRCDDLLNCLSPFMIYKIIKLHRLVSLKHISADVRMHTHNKELSACFHIAVGKFKFFSAFAHSHMPRYGAGQRKGMPFALSAEGQETHQPRRTQRETRKNDKTPAWRGRRAGSGLAGRPLSPALAPHVWFRSHKGVL